MAGYGFRLFNSDSHRYRFFGGAAQVLCIVSVTVAGLLVRLPDEHLRVGAERVHQKRPSVAAVKIEGDGVFAVSHAAILGAAVIAYCAYGNSKRFYAVF